MHKEYATGAANLTDYFVIPHENVSKEYSTGFAADPHRAKRNVC